MKSIAAGIAAGVMLGGSVAAHAEFTANITLASDYIFRGISQNDRDPAVQGSLGYEHSSGLYASVWGSQVDFGGDDDSDVELDYTAGWSGRMMQVVTFDLGAVYYDYPGGDSNNDFWEAFGALGLGMENFTFDMRLFRSWDFFGGTDNSVYFQTDFGFNTWWETHTLLHFGWQQIEDEQKFFDNENIDSTYWDWSLGVAKQFGGFNVDLTYSDSNLNDDECFNGTNLCDYRAVLSVGYDLNF